MTDNLIYRRFMSPTWLRSNAVWPSGGPPSSTSRRELQIDAPAGQYPLLFEVRNLIPTGLITSTDQFTVRINAALENRRGASDDVQKGQAPTGQPSGDISIMLSDNSEAQGFTLTAADQYTNRGPYEPIYGSPGGISLNRQNISFTAAPLSSNRYVQLFQIILRPRQDRWGRCYSAAENGHLIVFQYPRGIAAGNNPQLSLIAFGSERGNSQHNINYLDVAIYRDEH